MMSRSRFYFLSAFIAVLCVGLLFGPSTEKSKNPVQKLMPELRQQLGDVAQVKISDSKSAVTLARSDQGWVVVERDRYPANDQKIQKLLLSISGANLLEAKTQKAANHALLGVDEAAIRLQIDDGPILIIGNSASGRQGRYARFASEDQVWLQSALLPSLVAVPGRWLHQEIIHIASEDILGIAVSNQGDHLNVSRSLSAGVTVDGIAPDQFRYPGVADGLLKIFENLQLIDVSDVSDIDFSSASGVIVTLVDDTKVDVKLAFQQGRYWVSLMGPSIDDSVSGRAFEITRLNYDNMTQAAESLLKVKDDLNEL